MTEVQTPEQPEKMHDVSGERERIFNLLATDREASPAEIRQYMEDGTIDRLQELKNSQADVYYHTHRWVKAKITEIDLSKLTVSINFVGSSATRDLPIKTFLHWQEKADDNVKRLLQYEEDGTIDEAREYIPRLKTARIKRKRTGEFQVGEVVRFVNGGLDVEVQWIEPGTNKLLGKKVDTRRFLDWQKEN